MPGVIEVLEHVPPEFRGMVFEGVASMLRPGGVFVMTTPTPAMSLNAWDYPRPSSHDLEELLRQAGFSELETRFQHRLGTAFDPRIWRLISNRWFDLRFARHAIRRRFLFVEHRRCGDACRTHRDRSAALVKTRRLTRCGCWCCRRSHFRVSTRCSRVSSRNDCRRVVTMSDG